MKKTLIILIVTIISILSFFISFAQEDKNTIVIALFEEGDYKLTDQADTLLKLFLTNLFKEPFPDFTTVEIIHDQFLEEGTDSFYYIKFTSSDSIFRIAYWLDRKESLLTIQKEYNPFKSIILTCKGDSQCEPNAFVIDGKRMWGCSESLQCLPEGQSTCKSYQSLILPDKK